MDNIKAIISDYDGFYIISRDSLRGLYFSCPVFANKQAIIAKVEAHAMKFLGRAIPVEGLTKDYRLNSRMTEAESGSQFKFYEVLCATDFHDFLRMKIAVNDRFIYEIVNDTIVNQIAAERVIRIGLNRAKLRLVELYFASGEIVKFAMTSEQENSFISQVHGIIQQQSSDNKTRFFQNSLIFLGRMNIRSNIIWGIEQVPAFRESYEKENFETFIKEQREDNFLNYHFISGFSGFTLRNFFARFESVLNKPLKLVPAFALRTEFEDSVVNFLFRPTTSPIVIRTLAAHSSLEEDWFSKLGPEEKSLTEHMRRLIYQSRKIFRDQLKEVLNEECFGEKIENELLIDRMWSFLANMMQSGSIMKEVSVSLNNSNKADSECYVKLFYLAIKVLLQENASVISHNVGRFLNQFIDYSDENSKAKFEVLNKNFLIGKNQKFDFYECITYFLARILELPMLESRVFISRHILQIESILSIFENLIFRKKESTIEKDLQRTIDLLKSPMYFEVLSQLTLTTEPELVYKASVIMNVIIVCLNDKGKVREFQSQILDYSTLLLRHVEFCMGSAYAKQKHYSIIFICNCLIDNPSACNLMMRLIPKPLFYLVEDNLGDISKWSISQWEALFQNMNQNYNSATQQWNDESREELLVVLRRETRNFYSNYKPISETQTKAFIFEMFKSANYQISREQEEKIIQLKWNYEEYEVAHKSLKKKFPVYKFYIDEIVLDKPAPELTVKNYRHPKKFWDELCTTLIASTELGEKVKLLKCMILFYKNQFKMIKYTNLVSFLTKQIDQETESGFNYLILQLLFTLLENDPLHHNVRRFLDSNGLLVMRAFLQNNLFEDNVNAIDYAELEKEQRFQNADFSARAISKILFSAKLEMSKTEKSKCLENVVFLFNNPGVDREALTPELLRSNELIFCIKIFQQCILTTRSQTEESLLLIPKPLAKEVAFEPATIELFHKLLLLKDDKLMMAALDFIMVSYIDKFNFFAFIQNKWVFPMLLSRINKLNAPKISAFFEKVITSFYKIAVDEKKVLFEDLKTFNVNSPINDLALYSKDGNRLLQENKQLYEIFDHFPGFCLLPSYFFHVLLVKGADEFANTLFSEQFESPFMLWNKQALSSLQKLLELMLLNYAKGTKTEWETKTIHYSFADELTVGPILLKNWVFYSQYQSILPLSNIPDFLKTLTKQLKAILNTIPQANRDLLPKLKKFYMLTLAISCLYKNMNVFPNEEFEAIEKFLRYYSFHERDDFRIFGAEERNELDCCVINCLKIIYNSIKIENSFEQMDFGKSASLKLRVLKIFQRCVRNTIANELPVSFHQFKMNYIFLKILKKIFLINGHLMVSFKDPLTFAIAQSEQSLPNDSEAEEVVYDVNIVLANLDIMLVKNYIHMITNKNAKGDLLDLESGTGQGLDGKKELSEKIIKTNKSAFKRKKRVSGKDSIFEEQGVNDAKNALEKPVSLQNCQTQKEGPVEAGKRFEKNNKSIGNLETNKVEWPKTPVLPPTPEDNLVDFRIIVEETTQSNFKLLHKRLDRDAILKMTSNMDLSTNSIAEILLELKREVGEKVLQSQSRGTTFYHAIKKLLQSFFLLWVNIANTLSQNRKNTLAMIEASFPFIGFRIAILNAHMGNTLTTPVGGEITKFCASSMQIFKNLVYPVVELIYQLEKDSLYKQRLNEELRPEVVQNLVDSSNIAWLGTPDNIISYFDALAHFFTLPLLCYIINTQNNEAILNTFSKGLYELRILVNRQILLEMNTKLKAFVVQTLENNSYNDFRSLRNFEVLERSAHICIGDYYIENYVKSPQALTDCDEVYASTLKAVQVYAKSDSDLKTILEFLVRVIEVNALERPISQSELDVLLKTLSTATDIETKTLVLALLKKRLKSKLQDLDGPLQSVSFVIAMFESFFWIELLNQESSLTVAASRAEKLPPSFTEAQVKSLIVTYVSLLLFAAKHMRVSVFQEIMFHLSMVIPDEKIQRKLLVRLLALPDLRPAFKEFFALLVETQSAPKDPIDAILQCLRSRSVIHPLLFLSPRKFKDLQTSVFAYLKAVLEKLALSLQLASREEVPLDISAVYKNEFEAVVSFERINFSLLLVSKDNSFLLQDRYVSLIQRVEQRFPQLVPSQEAFKITISVLLLLRSHSFFAASCEFSENVLTLFFASGFASDPQCEILFLQYAGCIEGNAVMKEDRVVNFFKDYFAALSSAQKTEATATDFVFLECLLQIVAKRNGFLGWLSAEEGLVAVLMDLRTKFPKLEKVIEAILAFCVRNELFSETGIQGLKALDMKFFADLGKVNFEELFDRVYRRRFIEGVSDRHTVSYFMEKMNLEQGFVVLPLVCKPDLLSYGIN